jgi:hypothetical protein
VQIQKLLDVVLGALQDLDLSNTGMLKGIDGVALGLDFPSNRLSGQLGNNLLQVTRADFLDQNVKHLLSDLTHLGMLGIGGLFQLVLSTLGQSKDKKPQEVAVSGLDVHVGLNQSVPLSDDASQPVSGEFHSVEVGQALLSLDFVNAQLEFPVVGLFFLTFLVQIALGEFKDTATQSVISVLQALSAVDQGLGTMTIREHAWGQDVVPFLAGEWVYDFLFQAFLAFRQTFVLSNSLKYKKLEWMDGWIKGRDVPF